MLDTLSSMASLLCLGALWVTCLTLEIYCVCLVFCAAFLIVLPMLSWKLFWAISRALLIDVLTRFRLHTPEATMIPIRLRSGSPEVRCVGLDTALEGDQD
jgi:hypothetical protein